MSTTTINQQQPEARALLDAGAALGRVQQNPALHGAPFVIVPEGYNLLGLDEVTVAPGIKSTTKLRDARSFVAFVNDHKLPRSRIYATMEPAQFTAVLDDFHTADESDGSADDQAAHREYRAQFVVPASREWKTWTSRDKARMSQLEFAEFLQDNLPDVITPDGATLLELSLKFEASSAGKYVANQRLQDGSHDLQWKADANASGSVKLPEMLTLRLPVFEMTEPIEMQARLRYRLDMSDGRLSLWFELVRPHKVVEAAFHDTWKQIADGTQLPILLGTPE